MLPKDMRVYSSAISQYKGGVAVIVKNSFMQKCDAEPTWKDLVKGRLGRLQFNGAQGTLHVYVCYLDPELPAERDKDMRTPGNAMDDGVHNIVVGDFNFVICDADQISKTSAACESSAADKRNARAWSDIANQHSMKEFVQEEFTCENSHGWSRIDRAYTNLHIADLCAMRTACSLVDHPRHLSDYKPLSVVLTSSPKRNNKRNYVPRWVVAHEDFQMELGEELKAQGSDFVRCEQRKPKPFDKLLIFRKSVNHLRDISRGNVQGKWRTRLNTNWQYT